MKEYITIAKLLLKAIWSNLKFYLSIPPMLVFAVFLIPVGFFNLWGLRDACVKFLRGEMPESEQKEWSKKFIEIVNHVTFIFYIIVLYIYLRW